MDDDEKPSIVLAFEHYGVQILGPDRGSWRKSECPLPDHEDTNPSASVNEEACRWRCHTCDKGGDVFDLIMELETDVAGLFAARKRAAELFGESHSEVRGERGGSSLLPRRKGNQQRGSVRPAPWMRL